MKRQLFISVLAIFSFLLCSNRAVFAQNLSGVNPIQTGFAIVTPLDTVGQGLSVSEIFGENVNGNIFRSSVLPSPLVTLTSVVTRSDPNAGVDTGIAIVNVNVSSATVELRLNNQQGVSIGLRTLTIPGGHQISRFVTELFIGNPALSGPFNGLLFISTDVPVGVMGLSFIGPSFTSLPVAMQLPINGTFRAADFALSGTGNIAILSSQGGIETIAAVNLPITSSPVPSTPVPQTVPTPLPTTITQLPTTFSGLPPSQLGTSAVPLVSITPPSTVPVAGGVIVIPTEPIQTGVGGPGAQLLPQVVTGGGWVSTIAIANNSSVDLLVRVDFFSSDGGPLALPNGSTFPSILVPAGGVVTLSTN